MRKLAAVLLSLALTVSCLTGCSARNDVSGSENTQQSREQLLSDWFQLLSVHETIYSGVFRILDYMQMYVSDASWDSLLKARASASAAHIALQGMELPALSLTAEELSLLLPEDGDAIVFQQEFEMLEDLPFNKDITVSLLCYTLEDDVFLRASAEEALPAMEAFYREYFTLEYRYLSQFTNYLLLKLDCTEVWEDWKAALPRMALCSDIWYDDTEKLQMANESLQDSMSALQTQFGNILGTSEFTLEIVKEAVQTGDLSALQREIHVISGVPGYFPIPSWLPDVPHLYSVTDPDSGDKWLVTMGEELSSVPSVCYLSCGAISLENVEAYGEYLALWSIPTYSSWNDTGDTLSILAKSGSSSMLVEWTVENTLLYLAEPVGCLIPELYLLVMTAT